MSTISIIVVLFSGLIALYLLLNLFWFLGYYFLIRPIALLTFIGIFVQEAFGPNKLRFNLPKNGMKRIVADCAAAMCTIFMTLLLVTICKTPLSRNMDIFHIVPPLWGYLFLASLATLIIIIRRTEPSTKDWLEKIEDCGFPGFILHFIKKI